MCSVPWDSLNADEKADDVWSSALIFTVSKVTILGKRPVNFVFGAGAELTSPVGPIGRCESRRTSCFPAERSDLSA
jgi:hypothetical protein